MLERPLPPPRTACDLGHGPVSAMHSLGEWAHSPRSCVVQSIWSRPNSALSGSQDPVGSVLPKLSVAAFYLDAVTRYLKGASFFCIEWCVLTSFRLDHIGRCVVCSGSGRVECNPDWMYWVEEGGGGQSILVRKRP